MSLDPKLLAKLSPKSLDEITSRLEELIHRHRRRFIHKNMRPCPLNCLKAEAEGRRVTGCVCGSRNPDRCFNEAEFTPLYTQQELYDQFKSDIRDPVSLAANYRDLAVLFWVIGADCEDEAVVSQVEKRP